MTHNRKMNMKVHTQMYRKHTQIKQFENWHPIQVGNRTDQIYKISLLIKHGSTAQHMSHLLNNRKADLKANNTNLAKVPKNIISCKELLCARSAQNNPEDRIQCRLSLWLLSKYFTCKGITILWMIDYQICNASECLKWLQHSK